MRIDRLDHLVLTVRDIPATLDFYERVLGMTRVRFAEGRWALAFATPLAQIMQELARHGVPVILGPVRRTGAVGELDSIYIYDPDENPVELSHPVKS